MPRVEIPVNEVKSGGLARPAQTVADPANDHQFLNNGRVILEVENVNATTAQDVTFVTPGTVSGLDIQDRTVSVPAASVVLFSGIDPAAFNDSTGRCRVDVTSADLRFRAYRAGTPG